MLRELLFHDLGPTRVSIPKYFSNSLNGSIPLRSCLPCARASIKGVFFHFYKPDFRYINSFDRISYNSATAQQATADSSAAP